MVKTVVPEEGGIQLKEFGIALGQIAEEKGISQEKVIETVESALAAAYKKDYAQKGQVIRAQFDQEIGTAKFFLVKEVVDETTREFVDETQEDELEQEGAVVEEASSESEVEEDRLPRFNPDRDIELSIAKKVKKGVVLGDTIDMELEPHDTFGRVAAQTAKQVIIQKIREAERESMFKEYKEREGEIIVGTVERLEGRVVYVSMGKSVGVLFPGEQPQREQYRIGQRVKVYVARVDSDPKGPGIVLSRTSPELVRRLFELEVPEIFAGTVEIKAIAREAGERTKIAVTSTDEDVDPIGSCVGQKGTRVQTIIDELGGEKIDIIEWTDDIEKFIAKALSPAKALRVEISETKEDGALAKVLVSQDQLSLAIGRRGQNVRLASKLTGYRIDVGAPEEVSEQGTESNEQGAEDKEQEIVSNEQGVEDKGQKAEDAKPVSEIAEVEEKVEAVVEVSEEVKVETVEDSEKEEIVAEKKDKKTMKKKTE